MIIDWPRLSGSLLVILVMVFNPVNSLAAQISLRGTVVETGSAQPIIGASVLVVGTYDGGITDSEGQFNFATQRTSELQLEVSYLGYLTQSINLEIDKSDDPIIVQLRESVAALDAVVVTASTFKAGDNSRVAALKPMDVLTTAGAVGDVMAAIQTLPGTQANPEDGRLFVRGGEARETTIYVDGMKVFSPYTRTVGGSPSRGRFSPLLFGGVSFSSGGYSARYGQALSGVLELEIDNEPVTTQTNLNLMSLGVNVGHTQGWGDHSIGVNASYIDLSPYATLAPGRVDWIDPYRGFAGEAVYRHKTENGGLRAYLAADNTQMDLTRAQLDLQGIDTLGVRNLNYYGNVTFRTLLDDKTSLFAGLSTGYNRDRLSRNASPFNQQLRGVNARLSGKTVFSDQLTVAYGFDYLEETHQNSFSDQAPGATVRLTTPFGGSFIEANYFFSKNLALQTGLRAEQDFRQGKTNWLPRFTLAQKLGRNAQLSAGYGRFTQAVDQQWRLLAPQVAPERASHYLLNFNRKTEQQIFRAELYYKDYDDLLKFTDATNRETFRSTGTGYAYGLDLFWRIDELVKNVDCWVSYGWLEHQRDFRDFPTAATPNFSTQHNLSVVSKVWIPKLRFQLGMTFKYASGRPYENPNTPGFLNERSPAFRSVDFSWAYLIDAQKILFFSASNLTGFRNAFGYEYTSMPDENGYFPGRVLRPNDDFFLFAGFFVTLSPDQTKNQLDNL